MTYLQYLKLSLYGIKSIITKNKKPILGTIILTDACNLNCKHCAVNNINKIIHPYAEIKAEMIKMHREGIRILFFCGGETMLWQDKNIGIRELLNEARKIGFYIVNIVTNGTISLEIPEADIIFLSLDGLKETHNLIRGETYDKIMDNISNAEGSNICVYMAVNKINHEQIYEMGKMVLETKNLRSISFNFHTPYEGTKDLSLTQEEKVKAVSNIKRLINEGYPVFNLYSALDNYLKNKWDRPCYQCIVSENGRRYICGRCSEIEGLCDECGYLFAVEFSLLFKGNIKVIIDMLKTYWKYTYKKRKVK